MPFGRLELTEEKMIVGIDLGTTNSAVAVWLDGRPQLIPNSLGSYLTPSAVSVDEDGQVLVGMAARERQVTHPAVTATAFKRWMGTQRSTRLVAEKTFRPEELSALVLRSLKADAEAFLKEPVTEAVITVPAYFNDHQRKATRHAGELAGLKVERLLNEPTAAALAYGLHQRQAETQFLVFDLGGGTFDVSIVEIFEGIIEVRSSAGDNHLGGEDFNEMLIEEFYSARAASLGPRFREKSALHERVREQAERVRRELTKQHQATMTVTWQEQQIEHTVEAEHFEKLCEPLLERLREPVLRALRDGGIHADKLNEIVLVGGATRMPIVRRAVARMFGRFPGMGPNPDEAVALGAAVQAGLKARDAALKEVVMTDVCPYTLGVDVGERRPDGSMRTGIFAPIIERNTVVPASRFKSFSTVESGQRAVKFNIYQGEAPWVADNIALGAIEIPVPPQKAGFVAVEVRFTYDINGLLEVDVKVPQTGETRQLVVVGSQSDLSPAQIEERRSALAALKVPLRETEPNRAALARVARCYEHFLGERREMIAHMLRQFERILDSQDPRLIEQARMQLLQALDELEGESYL
jgi:molecular chaperone HscC